MILKKLPVFLLFVQTLVLTENIFATSSFSKTSVRNMGLAGSANLTAPAAFSAKENPASLPVWKSTKFSFGYALTNTNLKDCNSHEGTLPPSGMLSDSHKISDAEQVKIFSFGLSTPINSSISFGIAGTVPSGDMMKIHAFTANETTYLFYDDRKQRPEIFTSLGMALPKGIYAGVGIAYSLKASGTMQMAVSQDDAEARMVMGIRPAYMPFVGLLYQKIFGKKNENEFLLGTIYRHEHSPETTINTDVRFDIGMGAIPFSAISQLVAFYDPTIVGIGTALIMPEIKFFASMENIFWSKYQAPIIVLSGNDLGQLTDGTSAKSKIKLKDTWVYRIGTEIKNLINIDSFSLSTRFGIEYHTSALKKNPEIVKVVDTEKTTFGLGFELKIPKLEYLINKSFDLNIATNFTRLNSKTITGEAGNTISIGGNIFTCAGGINFDF